jgi:Na+-transporting methylmalonyl-CoA/oxaloacetate decarboxylase gamma subunit
LEPIILEGLSISLTAMLLTFLSLGLFILVMVVLQRMFPAESESADSKVVVKALDDNADPCGPSEEEAAVVAAIAAAVSYVRAQTQAGLGDNLKQGRGGWWGASYQRKPQKR